jgi:hypothetical protein
MKQHHSIVHFFSFAFLLLVVNAVLAPAYAYPGIRLVAQETEQVTDADRSTDRSDDTQETVSETAPFHAVTNVGWQVDVAKVSLLPPSPPQVVVVPVSIALPAQGSVFLPTYFTILFHTAIVPNAP